MRLRTKISHLVPGATDVTNSENTRVDLCHDAAYAHALVMALATIETSDAEYRPQYIVDGIRAKADEYMREWGYGGDDGCC